VVDEVLEDISEYFTAEMRPPREEKPENDLTLDFDRLTLFIDRTKEAAEKSRKEKEP
jgi:hypothetical protein